MSKQNRKGKQEREGGGEEKVEWLEILTCERLGFIGDRPHMGKMAQ